MISQTFNIQVTDLSKNLVKAVDVLSKRRVLVGVPQKNAPRTGSAANNAMLAAVHDTGAGRQPKREFLRTGLNEDKQRIIVKTELMGRAALSGNSQELNRAMHALGLEAQTAVKKKIQSGPFAPNKPATIRRWQKKHHVTSTNKRPLIDEAKMLNAVTYVIE